MAMPHTSPAASVPQPTPSAPAFTTPQVTPAAPSPEVDLLGFDMETSIAAPTTSMDMLAPTPFVAEPVPAPPSAPPAPSPAAPAPAAADPCKFVFIMYCRLPFYSQLITTT
jgi:hypothetical protein